MLQVGRAPKGNNWWKFARGDQRARTTRKTFGNLSGVGVGRPAGIFAGGFCIWG
jgi:hypothetical protein